MKEIKYTYEGTTLCYEIDENTKTAKVVIYKDEISENVIIQKEITYNNTTYLVVEISDGAFDTCEDLISVGTHF